MKLQQDELQRFKMLSRQKIWPTRSAQWLCENHEFRFHLPTLRTLPLHPAALRALAYDTFVTDRDLLWTYFAWICTIEGRLEALLASNWHDLLEPIHKLRRGRMSMAVGLREIRLRARGPAAPWLSPAEVCNLLTISTPCENACLIDAWAAQSVRHIFDAPVAPIRSDKNGFELLAPPSGEQFEAYCSATTQIGTLVKLHREDVEARIMAIPTQRRCPWHEYLHANGREAVRS